MSTNYVSQNISNSQRKRDKVNRFNKTYDENKIPKAENKPKKISRKSMQALAMMATLNYLDQLK